MVTYIKLDPLTRSQSKGRKSPARAAARTRLQRSRQPRGPRPQFKAFFFFGGGGGVGGFGVFGLGFLILGLFWF